MLDPEGMRKMKEGKAATLGAGSMCHCPQALQEEGRDPFSTLMEGLVLTRHQRSGTGGQHCSPILHSRHQGACALYQASVSAPGKGSCRDQPCILSWSSSCLLCYYFLLLHIICTPQQAIVPFHWLFISSNSLWGKISVQE